MRESQLQHIRCAERSISATTTPICAAWVDSSGRRNTRIERSCDGQAEAAEVGSGGAAEDAFAGTADGRPA
jgi:hypothetical protein